jgi:foldase protein PrsA
VFKALRLTSALGAVFFALVGLTACGGIPGDAVVQVDGSTSITNSAFDHWMEVAATSNSAGATGGKPVVPRPPDYSACISHLAATTPQAKGAAPPTNAQLKAQCATQYKSLQQEVLGFLISSQWVISEGKALGVKVTDAEVRKQFEKIKSTQFPKAAEFEKFLASSGQTVSDLLLRVKLNLLSSKIQRKIVAQKSTITTAAAEKYFNENKARYGVPEKRNIVEILTKDEATANKAKREIESGKSFGSVAKKYSIDPTSKNAGGLITGLTKGTQIKALDEAMFSAPLNKLTGPVKTPFGYMVFEVKSSTPGSQQSFSQVETAIKAQLAATGQQEALSKFVKQFRKKWTAKTDCRSSFVVADCKQYKAPKSTGLGTTPAG